jgi:hypothetical protein
MSNKSIKSAKQAFESNNVIITNIMQGRNGLVRIDARTRFNESGKDNLFSEWVSLSYANKLSMDRYGKKVNELNCFRY